MKFPLYVIVIIFLNIFLISPYEKDIEYDDLIEFPLQRGLNLIKFRKPDESTKFIQFQFHNPFNKMKVSFDRSFQDSSTQEGSHIGLIGYIHMILPSVNIFIQSEYMENITIWVRGVQYQDSYPIPGGCGNSKTVGYTVSTMLHTLEPFEDNIIEYFSSSLYIPLAAEPFKGFDLMCNNASRIRYHVYGLPMVMAGGSFSGALRNPSRKEVVSVIKDLFSSGDSPNAGINLGVIEHRNLESNYIRLPIVRQPGMALVITIIVEYYGDSANPKYSSFPPTVIYNCKECENEPNFFRHTSDRLNCNIFGNLNSSKYFIIGLITLIGLVHACLCSYLIWPRCLLSIYLTIFFFSISLICKINSKTPSVNLILLSMFLSSFLSLIVFLMLWYFLIRPSLPSLIADKLSSPSLFLFWSRNIKKLINRYNPQVNYETLENPQATGRPVIHERNQRRRRPIARRKQKKRILNSQNNTQTDTLLVGVVNAYSSRNENSSSSSYSPDESSDGRINQTNPFPSDITDTETTPLISGVNTSVSHASNTNNIGSSSSRTRFFRYIRIKVREYFTNWLLSWKAKALKTRRTARMFSIFPGLILLVGFFVLLVIGSHVQYSNYIWISILAFTVILFASLIYKNLSFSFFNCFFGVYIFLSGICLMFVPGTQIQQIIIELFLRFVWTRDRFSTIWITDVGRLDLALYLVWFIASFVLSVITLFIIRWQDVHETHFLKEFINNPSTTIRMNSNEPSAFNNSRLQRQRNPPVKSTRLLRPQHYGSMENNRLAVHESVVRGHFEPTD